MGISSSIGLISGIDTQALIDQLIQIESRPKQLAQRRIVELQQEQASWLDINSKLLAVKTASEAFRANDVFNASQVNSNNEAVLAATVTGKPAAGQYQFIVDQLVSTERRLSRGFGDRDVSGVGIRELTFEQGGGSVRNETELSELNGGQGVDRGKIEVTDRAGNTATVDISRAATIEDVLDAFNNSGVGVEASHNGYNFVIEDTSGGSSSNLIIEDAFGYSAAASLGITANVSSNQVIGTDLRTISRDTTLASLNDGLGVLVKDGSSDLRINTRNGQTINVDLGEKSRQVLKDDFLLDGTTYDAGTPLDDIKDLQAYIDLPDDEKPETENEITQRRATTIGDVIDIINAQAADQAGGAIEARIGPDQRSIEIVDSSGGTDNLVITNGTTGNTAASLGILADVASDTVGGRELIAGAGSVFVRNLNGGAGLSSDELTVTDRGGLETTVSLSTGGSLQRLVDRLNRDLEDEGNTVRFSVNDVGNGLSFRDVSDDPADTGDIEIGGAAAGELGVEGTFGVGHSGQGESVQLKWIDLGTKVADLNNGSGIGTGRIRITDASGISNEINIGGGVETVDDLLRQLNSNGNLGVTATINANGDGIMLTDTSGGAGSLVIEDVDGAVAEKLNLLGSFGEEDGAIVADGSYERVLEFTGTETLNEIVNRINNENVGVNASVINDGSGSAPYRLALTAERTGSAGRVMFSSEGTDLGMRTVDEGRDARTFFGAEDPAFGVLITSSTNTLTDAIEGVTIDLKQTSDDLVTVSVGSDQTKAVDAVTQFVTAFNTALDGLAKQSAYNEETERAAPLLGSSAVSNIERRLYSIVQGRAQSVSGPYQRLFQIGIKVGDGARLEFDRETFEEAYRDDPAAVEDLLAAFEQKPREPIQVAPGITVNNTGDDEFKSLGVAEQLAVLIEDFTNSIDGYVTGQTDLIDTQIDLQEGRIENFDKQLLSKRQRLEFEFMQMEMAIASLQEQQSALGQLNTAG